MTPIAIGSQRIRPARPVEVGIERVELAHREQGGISVTLLWLRGTAIVLVAVADRRLRRCFELVLEPGERAWDVFHHPYAYASARGMDTTPAPPASEEEPSLPDRLAA
jgi:hypothetical protein